MATGPFIQVILPLHLEWEPFYSLPGAKTGDRVKVEFAHRQYVGVVSATDVTPHLENILPAEPTDLPPIFPQEIQFWRTLSSYYLCTVGEVYKAAYPTMLRQGKSRKEPVKADSAPQELSLPPEHQKALKGILEGFAAKNTVLLKGSTPDVYLELARQTLQSSKSVLLLVPEIALSRQLEQRAREVFPQLLTYHSQESPANRRLVAKVLRKQAPSVVLGTRSALFLPYHNLGLIIVTEEQDTSYKQDSPAPRYHARESAIFLAGIHHAKVLLTSETPSLESLYNAENGLFTMVECKQSLGSGVSVISTSAEAHKRGMFGSFSLKLLEAMHSTLDAGEKVLVVCRSKAAIQECEKELAGVFPEGSVSTITPAGIKLVPRGEYALAAVLQADGLLGKEDFRADEKTLQLLRQLRSRVSGQLIVQTREQAHPVFRALRSGEDTLILLPERQEAGFPPLTRMIDVVMRDKNEKRLNYLSALLSRSLAFLPTVLGPFSPAQDMQADGENRRIIRLLLPRDRQLLRRKEALLAAIAAFEKDCSYKGHIVLDVDPV